MKIFSCTFYVEPHSTNYPKVKPWDLVKVEQRYERTIQELMDVSIGFSLHTIDDKMVCWADDLQFGEQEVCVSAPNMLEAIVRAQEACRHLSKGISTKGSKE